MNNEVIQYTGNAANTFTGCTRGTNAQFRGVYIQKIQQPVLMIQQTQLVVWRVFYNYGTNERYTTSRNGQPSTVTQENKLHF